jgi:ABC-type Mn2+/Zn2+ transport system ATPase subunit
MPFISLIDAGYKYSGTGKWVFRHFDMSIELGEAVRIVGCNGSGKTTLLKVLSGLLELREGAFRKERKTKVAYMDQFSGEMLARDLTIGEQLKAAASDEASRVAAIDKLDAFGLGLEGRVEEFIGHLSGGQRQIVALLSTLAAGASVVCLDEFTTSMDDHSMQVADELLLHAKTTTNVTFVLVSHAAMAVKTDRELTLVTSQSFAKT